MTDPRQSALDILTKRFVELGGAGQRSLFLRCLSSELRWCFSVGVTRVRMWQGLQASGYSGSYAQFARAFRNVVAEKEPQPPTPSHRSCLRTFQPDDDVLAQQIRLERARQKAEAMRAASVPPPKKFEYNP